MSDYGFFIKRLRVGSQNPAIKPADLTFTKGLNVISGPSNTGKSVVFACLNYMLGAKEYTKRVPQLKHYHYASIEIETFDGKVYTFARSFNEPTRIRFKEGSLDDDIKGVPLTSKHSETGNNISYKLLEFSGFPKGTLLRKNEYSETKPLSFRDIFGFTCIDETRIVTEKSVINFTEQHNERPVNKAIFDFILSGENANHLKAIERDEVYAGRIRGKIELISTLIENLQSEIGDIEELNFYGQNVNELLEGTNIDNTLDNLYNKLESATSNLDSLTKRKEELYEFITESKSELILKAELLNRFQLLEKHYHSDLKRLEFISETEHYFSQLVSVDCPLCGGALDKEHYKCIGKSSNTSIEEFKISLEKEREKIDLKLHDLLETMENLSIERANKEAQLTQAASELKAIENKIKEQLEPVTFNIRNEIESLVDKKAKLSRYKFLQEQRDAFIKDKINLQGELSSKPSKPKTGKAFIYQAYYKPFEKEIETFLENINFDRDVKVHIDTHADNLDYRINGVKRTTNGKGIRAITYSAFVVSIMNYCISNGMPHPKCVILDSPLTTYHGKEQPKPEEIEDVPMDLQQSFFSKLANMPQDRQVIILDNKVPDEFLLHRINFIEFTDSELYGRQGFIPQNQIN